MKLIPMGKIILNKGKYLSFCKRGFLDKEGKKREYEFVERNNDQKAVVLIGEKDENLLLIKQYRVPICDYIIEFPAGLIENNENIEDAAIRELLEETGYNGKIKEISPITLTSAGLTTEQVYFLKIDILSYSGSNCESSEDIEVIWVDKKRWEDLKKSNIFINGWVYSYIEGKYNNN